MKTFTKIKKGYIYKKNSFLCKLIISPNIFAGMKICNFDFDLIGHDSLKFCSCAISIGFAKIWTINFCVELSCIFLLIGMGIISKKKYQNG